MPRFPKQHVSLVIVLLLATCVLSQGAVHYFLLQGNFDASTSAVETYKFKVTDNGGVLQDGQDLMNNIFGTPINVGSTNEYRSTGSGFDISYTYYSDYDSYLINSIKLSSSSTVLSTNGSLGVSWNGYSSGGGYADAFLFDPVLEEYVGPLTGPYADGTWTYGYTGMSQRSLLDIDGDGTLEASYDGWVFGNDGYTWLNGNEPLPASTIEGSGNSPLAGSFDGPGTSVTNGNGVIVFSYSAVPEPGRMLFLAFSFACICLQRKRRMREVAC